MLGLHNLKNFRGARKKRKVVGRGGCHGTFSGRGCKGQKARSGHSRRSGFEGGRTPLCRQLPKFKGNSSLLGKPAAITFGHLNKYFADGKMVTGQALSKAGLISKPGSPWKIVKTGKLVKKVMVLSGKATKEAAKDILALGGRIVEKKKIDTRKEEKKEQENFKTKL